MSSWYCNGYAHVKSQLTAHMKAKVLGYNLVWMCKERVNLEITSTQLKCMNLISKDSFKESNVKILTF